MDERIHVEAILFAFGEADGPTPYIRVFFPICSLLLFDLAAANTHVELSELTCFGLFFLYFSCL